MSGRLVILGAGVSGTGAAVLANTLSDYKGKVFVSDYSSIKPKYKDLLRQHSIDYEENTHNTERILSASEIIKSPGIPESNELIKKIRNAGIKLISEIEFAGRYTTAKKICITGSNGKTTTTMLVNHILQKAGISTGLAGNVGESFALQVAMNRDNQPDYYVLEISSFQLDDMFDFKADIAVLLNITPDHLDRYNYKFQEYINSKFRIIRNQGKDDVFIYCADDQVISTELTKLKISSMCIPFSIETQPDKGAYLKDNNLIVNINKNTFKMMVDELSLHGKHNVYNSMAAAITASALNIRKETIRECLADFQGVEHRLELVMQIHGIFFVNDSKATNINSTWYALESMKTKVVWIVGGIDKGNDYSMLSDLVQEKVRAIVCLGVDNTKIHQAFEGKVEVITDTTSMKEAVRNAYYLARNGDTILLSPACASFDLFENYEDRGKQFKLAVREL